MKAIIDLYLYSSLHIALCAMGFTTATYMLAGMPINWNYSLFVAAGTCVIYSLHRIVGINKVSASIIDNRFQVIRQYRSHMIVYMIIASILAVYTFWHIPMQGKIQLIIPCILALLYVLPLLVENKRLRDYNYIKILLISACWAILCGLIPLSQVNASPEMLSLFTLEKCIFIFAITLPFDYRDRKVDTISKVKTFAHILGDKILYAILMSFILCIALVLINPLYEMKTKILLVVIYFILDAITRFATKRESDYYFSGIIDGTMLLFAILVYTGIQYFV